MKISKKYGVVFAFILALVVCNGIVFTSFYLSEKFKLTGGVRSAVLSFELYDEDGVTPLERFDFPKFVEGRVSTYYKQFYLNNTGDDSLIFEWNITDTSITWTLAGDTKEGHYYVYEEAVDGVKVLKYEFEILVKPFLSPVYVRFSAEYPVITLGPGEGVPCRIRFTYTGEPDTLEKIQWKPKFFAYETFPSD